MPCPIPSFSQRMLAAELVPLQAMHQVQGALLLDVVVCQGALNLQLLAGKDDALLLHRDALAAGGDDCTQWAGRNARAAKKADAGF